MKYIEMEPSKMLNPLPVVLVSCKGTAEDAKPNMITIAWTGTINSDPPMISVSIQPRRYSHDLVRDSGEFVVNLTDEALCRKTDLCGVKSGRDTDKFALTGLRPMEAPGMKYAPAVEGTPAAISCRVRQIIPLGSHDLFLGEVVGVLVRPDLIDDRNAIHLERAKLIVYNHGLYQKTADVMGYFGYSVSEPEVFRNRMKQYRKR